MEFTMPIPLRDDFDAAELRREAKKSKDGGQARRLLALAAIYEGSTQTEAAKIGGVTLSDRPGLGCQVQRPWPLRAHRRQGGGADPAADGRAPPQRWLAWWR